VSDLSARRLSRGGAERLLRLAARGGVLVTLGGPESYGPGGWAGTSFEAVLPLRSPSGEEGETAVVLCLDTSGSTGETPAGGAASSRDALLEAAATLLDALPAGARVAVLPFRSAPFPAPLDPAWTGAADATGKSALLASLRALSPEGGTDLPAAIVAGARLAGSRPAKRRLVLVATDGDPDHAPSAAAYAAARAALVASGASLAAVVRGDAPAADALRDLAGGERRVARIGAAGEFADALARVFHEAARGAEVVDGAFAVSATPGSEEDAASLTTAAPRRAHVLEVAPGAAVLAQMRRDGEAPRPFAAARAIGAGVVGAVAWGPALEDPAARDAARRALGPFLARIARRGDRGLEAFEEAGGLVVRAPAGLGSLRVRRGADGDPAVLIERAPGVYGGDPPFDAPAADAAPVFAEVAPGTWRPLRGTARPALEHRGVGVDGAALAALARAGGGRRLAPGEEPGPSRRPSSTPLSPALLAIAVMLFVAERARASRALAEAAVRGGAPTREAA
jgi:Ca-activated chloride channel family protein